MRQTDQRNSRAFDYTPPWVARPFSSFVTMEYVKTYRTRRRVMTDEPFTTPGHRPAPRAADAGRDALRVLPRADTRWLCELRDHETYGIEAQFWEHEEFRYNRRFETRALAVQWAEEERKAIEKGGP